ncbi:GAF domain-containing protein [archaeon]|nr:MAG: GAF domain-containing protein [archaeon]
MLPPDPRHPHPLPNPFSADKMSGYRTNTILCMPIKSGEGQIVGVLQAINKKDGTFGTTDEDVMAMLATQAGIALQNANLFRHAGKRVRIGVRMGVYGI